MTPHSAGTRLTSTGHTCSSTHAASARSLLFLNDELRKARVYCSVVDGAAVRPPTTHSAAS